MKKILHLVLLLPLVVFAQQQEHFSMYMMNNFIVNPAEAGTEDFIDLQLGFRQQWVDHGPGAPQNFFFSGHAAIGKEESSIATRILPFHGVGAALIADNIGPFQIYNAKVAYAYHLPVYKSFILSVGAFGGLKQIGYNSESVEWSRNNLDVDPLFSTSQTTITPDLSAGLWGYSKKFYFGITAFQLLNNKIEVSSPDAEGVSNATLKMHYWATAGYNIMLDSAQHWNLVPSFVVKAVEGAPVSFDVNMKIKWNNTLWGGVSYRYQDAVVFIGGITYKKLVDIGYSYDYTLSSLKNTSSGSHEILIGLRFPNHEHKPAQPQFW